MGTVARTVLQYNCNHADTFLRLCKKSYHSIGINHALTTDRSKAFPDKYKCFLPPRRYASITLHKSQLTNSLEPNKYVPEHKVIHAILEDSIYYKDSIIPPIKTNATVTSEEISELYRIDWSLVPTQHIFNAVKKLTYCHISGSRFEVSLYNSVLQGLAPKLPELQDHQIKILLQCLIALKDITEKTNVYKSFTKALNIECLKRFFSATTKELLLVSDAFYQLQYLESDYLWRAIRKLTGKPERLSSKALVQVMFLLNVAKIGSTINMFEIECRFEECIHELSGNEIGIIARGFFLQKRGIRNKSLMPIILTKVAQCAHTMDSTSLASTMKLIRYSDCVHCLPQFQNLLVSLRKEIQRLSLKCLTHITHAFGGLRVYDEILTNKIVERVKNEVQQARIKDIERIIYGISSVTPFTDYYNDICHALLNEVLLNYQTNRSAEINRFPVSFARILTFLTVKNIYVPELIRYTFDPAFVQKMYRNNLKLLSNELLSLHCSVKIEMPNYTGPLLRDHLYKYLTNKYSFSDDIHRKDNTVKFRTEVVFISKIKLGINVCVDYILPHYSTRDIVFGMDEHNNTVDIEPILSGMPAGSIKSVNSDELKNIKWKVLFLLPSIIKVLGHDGYCGPMYRKFRQFKAIGYTPLPICEQKWNSYSSEEEKENYLRQLIYQENNIDL